MLVLGGVSGGSNWTENSGLGSHQQVGPVSVRMCVCVREREWGVLPAMVSCLNSGTQEAEELYLLIQAWASRRKREKVKRVHWTFNRNRLGIQQ